MGVHQVERIVRPTSREEAWEIREREASASRFLAGGVDLVLYAPPSVTTLIDLSGLGLDGVREEGDEVVLGAMATLSEVLESEIVRDVAGGFLSTVLRRVASPLQRNAATIGGAVVRAHPWSDVVPALLVLDARLDAFDGRERSLDVADSSPRGESLPPLVLAVRLPGAARRRRASFEKFARVGFDVSVLNCACSARVEGGVCRDVRVAIGGTPSLARRLPGVEQMLEGRALDPDRIASAGRQGSEEIDARDDRRATADYRRRLADVGLRRCLASWQELKGRRVR